MQSARAVIKRTLVSFYDDQMTHHAAALTYYALMSLFPATLLALSLLGLLGQYPSTYNAIIDYLRGVVPHSVLVPLDSSLREALQHKGTALTALVTSVLLTLYGTTGVLEAARRALNVVFELDAGGRSFLRRKSIDIVFTFLLMGLVLTSLIMLFLGGRFASDVFGFVGLGPTAASVWSVVRWPGALAVTTLIFALIYYVTPDVKQRAFRWVTPGALVGVLVWLVASVGFSVYISQVANVGALFGAFAGAIVLVGWLWLTNVALLFGAELDAEIERQKELREGVPETQTLNLPTRARHGPPLRPPDQG
jgi:membrane protein